MGGLRIQGVYAHGQPWTAGMEGKKTEDCGRDKHAIVNQHAVRDIMFFNQSVNRDAPLPESYFQTDSNAAKSLRRQYPQVNFIFVETNVYYFYDTIDPLRIQYEIMPENVRKF